MRPGQRPALALVIFDLDGTLVDSFADIRAGIREACRAIGVEAEERLLALATRGVSLDEFFHEATGVAAAEAGARFGAFFEAYRQHYLPTCLVTTHPYPGVEKTLAALRARGLRLAVATTKRTETAQRVLEGTDLLRRLDAVAGSDGLPHKPDPSVLRRAASMAGVELERAVMVGDTDRDVLAARAVGIPAVGVTWGGFSEEEMRALDPDHVVRRFEELVDVLA